MNCLVEQDLPSSYQAANESSIRSQKKYLRIFLTILVATLIGTISAWCAAVFVSEKLLFDCGTVLSMLSVLVLTSALKERKYEQSWYMGRAIAESIKTRSWCFMTCSAPYQRDIPDQEARRRLLEDIRKILNEHEPIVLTSDIARPLPEISAAMEVVRGSSLHERLEIYRKYRIVDQKRWYRTKATISERSEGRAFILMHICQIVAILLAVVSYFHNLATSGSVGVFALLSSSVLAWLQVKKYQETALAYSIASQELGLAEGLSKCIKTEGEFSSFVQDSEAAISREHTLWVARRTMR